MVAIVDDGDFEFLNQWKWKAVTARDTWYATRTHWPNGKHAKCETVIMHRLIMGITDRNVICDHKDHNGLNNQKANLRTCTKKQNVYNTKSRKGSSSKYLGVSWKKKINKWQVLIQKDGNFKYLGVYKDEIEAAKAYNKEAAILFGEFANLNPVS